MRASLEGDGRDAGSLQKGAEEVERKKSTDETAWTGSRKEKMVSSSFPSSRVFLRPVELTKSVFSPPEPSDTSLRSLIEQGKVGIEVLDETKEGEEGRSAR